MPQTPGWHMRQARLRAKVSYTFECFPIIRIIKDFKLVATPKLVRVILSMLIELLTTQIAY